MAFPARTWFHKQLVTAAMLNEGLRDNLVTLNGGGVVPVGMVVLWGADASLIPSGWDLCDGGGGRLDLRDKFPIGAGNLYAVGDTGGFISTTLGAHSTHVVTQPGHANHIPTQATAHGGPISGAGTGPPPGFIPGGPGFTGSGIHTGFDVDGHSAHSDAALDGHASHSAVATLPPYHARAFMQKATSGLSFTTPRTWVSGDIPTALMFNAEFRDNMAYLLANVMPLGAIIMWGNPIATGGSATASLAAHAAHSPTQAAPHSDHTITSQPADHADATIFSGGGTSILSGHDHVGMSIDPHSAHSGFGVNGHSAHAIAGVTGAFSILPPYFAEAYIQLVSVPTPPAPHTWADHDDVQANLFNTLIRDNENAILAAQFPINGVGIWSGSLATVPANYLAVQADVMYIGAGNHYPVSASGGAVSVQPDAHPAHTVSQPSNHTNHVVGQPADHGVSATNGGASGVYTPPETHNFALDPHDHHAFTVDAGAAHSAHLAITTLPPYLAVAFAERVS